VDGAVRGPSVECGEGGLLRPGDGHTGVEPDQQRVLGKQDTGGHRKYIGSVGFTR